MIKRVENELDTKSFGESIGKLLSGGEVIELVGDVGAGKTTFVKGLAMGMGVDDEVQSPSFTISRVYNCLNGLRLTHYDFYRLSDAGIMSNELKEDLEDQNVVVVIEWGGLVSGVLPADRLRINMKMISDNERELELVADGNKSKSILERIEHAATD